MTNYFYIDATGQKQGPVSDSHFQELVAKGIVMPDTPLETDTGYKGNAGQITELIFTAIVPTSPTNHFSAVPPNTDTDSRPVKNRSPFGAWIVFAMGIMGIVCSWAIIHSDKLKWLSGMIYG